MEVWWNNTEGGKGKYSGEKSPVTVALRPPQNSHRLTWDWPPDAAVRSRRPTAWGTAEQCDYVTAELRSASQHNVIFGKIFHGW